MLEDGVLDPFVPRTVFGRPLFVCSVDGAEAHNPALAEEIRRQRAADPTGDPRSIRHGWHSGDRLRQCRHPSLGWVLRRCFAFSTRALASRYGDWGAHTLKLRSFWANVLDEGGRHVAHHHRPRHWSGVYYVAVGAIGQADDLSGCLEILAPDADPDSPGMVEHVLRPRDGQLVLFPSSLEHRVLPVTSERITLAFNFDVEPG